MLRSITRGLVHKKHALKPAIDYVARQSLSRLQSSISNLPKNELSIPVADAVDDYYAEHRISISALAESLDKTPGFATGEEDDVIISSNASYSPMLDFSNTGFSGKLQTVLKKEGFQAPTPIQAAAWPVVLAGKDVISVARTGSGKTLGFLLPAFHKIIGEKAVHQRRSPLPKVLVLAPTRELVLQISQEAEKYRLPVINKKQQQRKGRSYGSRQQQNNKLINTVAVFGGASRLMQMKALQRGGVDVVVATPGRCIDLADIGALDLSQVEYLVLDEADRMLDMGFEPQVRRILDQLPPAANRQTLFFTATWPVEVRALSRDFLCSSNAMQINIGTGGADGLAAHELFANKAITQRFQIISNRSGNGMMRSKQQALVELLRSELLNPASSHAQSIEKTIIFVGRKLHCEELVFLLRNEGYSVDALHGDKTQSMRSRVMDRFRTGKLSVLVATDIASRGLDVRDVKHVINFDFPDSGVEDYVHRIGRTARGSASGVAHTFLTSGNLTNTALVKDLVGVLQRAEQEVPQELLVAAQKKQQRFQRHNNRWDDARGKNFNDHRRSSRGNYNKHGGGVGGNRWNRKADFTNNGYPSRSRDHWDTAVAHKRSNRRGGGGWHSDFDFEDDDDDYYYNDGHASRNRSRGSSRKSSRVYD